jgi:mRNA interferase MazF
LGDWAKDSVIECGHLRSIDRDARISKVVGHLTAEVMAKVDDALKVSVGLKMTV